MASAPDTAQAATRPAPGRNLDPLLGALAAGVEVFDLGRPYEAGMAQSPNHPPFRHALDRRHGDRIREGGGSAAADIIVLGCHVGTHIDALAHVSQDGLLHDGVDAQEAQRGGRFMESGVHTIAPIVSRGVVLDVPAALGAGTSTTGYLPGGYEITVADLEATLTRQAIDIHPGDTVLIRSGWGMRFAEGAAYLGAESGVPGVSEAGARWLAGSGAAAVGADTIAFEMLPPGDGHASLPAHRVLLVEAGMPIIETLDLEGVAGAGVHEFMFVLSHLNIVGATGAPVRPLAIASTERIPAGGAATVRAHP